MQRSFAVVASVAALAAAAVALLGVWGAAPAAPRDETVALVRHAGVSRLVDGEGRTLFVRAGEGRMPGRCAGACARDWEPVTTAASVRVGAGVRGRLLGFADRPGGREQVTYAGRPLYRRAAGSAGPAPAGWAPVGPGGRSPSRAEIHEVVTQDRGWGR